MPKTDKNMRNICKQGMKSREEDIKINERRKDGLIDNSLVIEKKHDNKLNTENAKKLYAQC